MQKTFETPGPTSLYVELGAGTVSIQADEVAQTTVDVQGRNAEEVTVDQRGDQIVVIAPQRRSGFFGGGSNEFQVHVTMPSDSRLATKLGSADVSVAGRIGETSIKSGSGDVQVAEITDSADIQTGSGDVQIGYAASPVEVKSGSGDLRVRDAHEDVALTTASGDLLVDVMRRGQLLAKNVSGDIRVGIPAGVPVWTDVSSMTGSVSSSLEGAGQPEEGQDYIELRAKTISGDIVLEQL
jgi:hypothetical protein